MYSVYRSLSKISTKELEDYSLEDVTWMFQQTDNKVFRNRCYTYVFKHLFAMLLKIHHKPAFASLPYEDRTEECMLRVLVCMEKWNENKKVKLITYIHTSVNNALKTLVTLSKNGKHNVYNNLISCDEKTTKYILESIPYTDNYRELEYKNFLNNNSIFSKDESILCQKIAEGYKTARELATQIKKDCITTYSKSKKQYLTSPLDNDGLIKYCGKLRTNIKKKLSAKIFN